MAGNKPVLVEHFSPQKMLQVGEPNLGRGPLLSNLPYAARVSTCSTGVLYLTPFPLVHQLLFRQLCPLQDTVDCCLPSQTSVMVVCKVNLKRPWQRTRHVHFICRSHQLIEMALFYVLGVKDLQAPTIVVHPISDFHAVPISGGI